MTSAVRVMDGPLGALLADRGYDPSRDPAWSAGALREVPTIVSTIHHDYVATGAHLHRACTFRARETTLGRDWRRLTSLAVSLAREAVDAALLSSGAPQRSGAWVLGSVGPIEDCYMPEKSPPTTEVRALNRPFLAHLLAAGVDGIICETFPNVAEGLVVLEESVALEIPTALSFTAGPNGDLLTPQQVAEGAKQAVLRGAQAVMVNCIAADLCAPYVESLLDGVARSGGSAKVGVMANGSRWGEPPVSVSRYVDLAKKWRELGASVIGACCGAGPQTITGLVAAMGSNPSERTSLLWG